jgi:hypothetical protein
MALVFTIFEMLMKMEQGLGLEYVTLPGNILNGQGFGLSSCRLMNSFSIELRKLLHIFPAHIPLKLLLSTGHRVKRQGDLSSSLQ